MQELKTDELKEYDGGSIIAIGLKQLLLLSSGIPFVIGVIDGFIRPLPYRS